MRNKIKSFIETQGMTVYQFRQRTGIANKTAYDLVNKPDQYPARDVMDKICSAFKVQPCELLEWVDDAAADDSDRPSPAPAPEPEQPAKKRRTRRTGEPSMLTIDPSAEVFAPGDLVQLPSGDRAIVERVVGETALVRWQSKELIDTFQLRMLKRIEAA